MEQIAQTVLAGLSDWNDVEEEIEFDRSRFYLNTFHDHVKFYANFAYLLKIRRYVSS